MKICFLGSAASIHTFRWVKFFSDRGHQILWLSLASPTFNDLNNVQFEILPSVRKCAQKRANPLAFLSALRKTKEFIRRFDPDVIHAHYVGSYGLVGALTGRHPFVATAWGSDVLFAAQSIVKRPLVQYTLRQADLITCDAEHMIMAICDLGIGRSKVRRINFGVDSTKFFPRQIGPDALKKYGVNDQPTVLSLRRLESVYDIGTLMKAAPIILQRRPNTVFLIAGTGSQEEPLVELTKMLGIEDNVRFIGDVPNDELPLLLSAVDVYVSTSLSDAGLSSCTAEAMACARPVVVTDSGENHLWIQSGITGFLTPSQNSTRLADNVLSLLDDDLLRSKIGRAGREKILSDNDERTEMNKMELLYEYLAH